MSYPMSPTVQPKRVKSHRQMFFEPVYKRDGYESQEAYDLAMWGEGLCRYYASEEGHERKERAIAALKTLNKS